MGEIQFFDASNVDSLHWPDTEEGELAKHYLFPLIKEGTECYIKNAKTRLYILTLDNLIIPITVNEEEYENSYLLSSYFVAASLQEKLQEASHMIRFCSKPMINLFAKTLKWLKINKLVIINNWLLTTNLYPDLDQRQVRSITNFLKIRFPDHYLMFRSVNTYKSSAVFEGLNLQNYRMIPSRNIYLYDPSRTGKLSSSIIRKQKKDSNKLKKAPYHVEIADSLNNQEIERLLELYQNVYISKYTKYSPLYTEKYLREALERKILKIKLLKKDGQIYGVTGFLKKNGYLLVPFFGYDTTLPQEEGLYRMLSSVIMDEIEANQLISHQGSGAADFKKWRGFIEQQEYVAIYDHHLPPIRRLFWFLGEKFSCYRHHKVKLRKYVPDDLQSD